MVSIIIPAYNVYDYIDTCLESVVNQTFRDIEIILINDGSTDGTDKKCDEWAKKDNRIVYINKQNEGQGPTRNLGINISKGEYITFIDSDDWYESTAIEKLYNAIKKYEADIIFCDSTCVVQDEQGGVINKYIYKYPILLEQPTNVYEKPELIYKVGPELCMKIYRRDLFVYNNISQPNHPCEDESVKPSLLVNAKRIFHINEALYNYRLNRKGQTTENINNILFSKKSMYEVITYFNEYNLYSQFNHAIERNCINIIKYIFGRVDKLEDLTIKNKIKKEFLKFLDMQFPMWNKSQDVKYIVFGSYNLRKIIGNSLYFPSNVIQHFCFSSIISLMSRPINNTSLYHDNIFRENMVKQDISKKFIISQTTEDKCVIIDFLEERFDIGKINDTYFTLSDAFLESKVYGMDSFISLSRLNPLTQKLWEERCLNFIEYLKMHYNPSKIILVRLLLTEYSGDYGKKVKFSDFGKITEINKLLNECYDFFEKNYPGIKTINIDYDNLIFTDVNFPFGCHPYHFNEFLYSKIYDTIEDYLRGC